jgi:hypothetical protein
MQVKVWNDNVHDFNDPDFKGNPIKIPAGKYIEMDREEAVDFKGKYHAPEVDGEGVAKPESFKMIRIEEPKKGSYAETGPKKQTHKCQACGEEWLSEEQLLKHIRTEHADQWADDKEDVEKALKKQEEEKKRGRGRPKGT